MNVRRWLWVLNLMLVGPLVAACGTPAATPEPDRIATRVAEDRAVAATLTTEAKEAETPAPSPTSAAFNTPVPPTETPVPATNSPTPQQVDPIVPGFGDPRGLAGEIRLPGYTGPLDLPLFGDRVVFQLKVRDPDAGNHDGAGIIAVNFSITGPQGNTVHEQREQNAAYCPFGNPGNSPKCTVWVFADHANQWPNGDPVCEGVYTANMNVETDNPNKDGALWRFQFRITSRDGSLSPCQ